MRFLAQLFQIGQQFGAALFELLDSCQVTRPGFGEALPDSSHLRRLAKLRAARGVICGA
jgi:hypothetical protein